MLRDMDWQETTALLIVAATAVTLAWTKLRPRKFSFRRDAHCGCSSLSSAESQPSIVFQARKGEAPRVVIKMR